MEFKLEYDFDYKMIPENSPTIIISSPGIPEAMFKIIFSDEL